MVRILIFVAALFSIAAYASPPLAVPPVASTNPRVWQANSFTRDPPTHTLYLGTQFLISGKKDAPRNSVFGAWAKIVFDDPQPLNKKETYAIEVLLLRLDCKRHKYSVMRDLKYDASGRVLADSKKTSRSTGFDLYFSGDTGKLPLAEQAAVVTSQWACFPPAE